MDSFRTVCCVPYAEKHPVMEWIPLKNESDMGNMKRRMAVVFCLVGMLLPAMGQEDGAAKGEGASGGRTVALWGHVKDAFTYVGIPDVFITLMRADSTAVDTMHVACANPGTPQMDSYYKFDVPAAPQRFIIKAEHPDYRTTYVDFRLRRIGRNTYVDAPHHEMRRKPYDPFSDRALDEVVVKATKIRVAYKGDTLVYNADAFNLPEGSMLDELIRQMPGVELKQNGEIYVNGRKVDYLTLNGTDFFKGDNRKMLDNLPSYTVQQVKVYHKDTERSAFLGYGVDPQEYVMDVRLKREYNSGYMANASLGGGTDSRYKGQAFGMRYSDRSRVSLFGSANNTNAVYGRPGENGEWPEESMKNGEFVAQSVGGEFFFADKGRGLENTLTADAGWSGQDMRQQEARESYLAVGSHFGRTATKWNADVANFHAGNELKWKTRNTLFTVKDRVSYSRTDSRGETRSGTLDADPSPVGGAETVVDSLFSPSAEWRGPGQVLNRQFTRSQGKAWNYGLSHDMAFDAKLPWGDNLQVCFITSYARWGNRAFEHYRLDYPASGEAADSRNRFEDSKKRQYSFQPSAEYVFNFLNNWHFLTYYIYKQNFKGDHIPRYRLERLAGWDVDEGHALGELPSNHNELLSALDAANSSDRWDLTRDHLLGLRYFYSLQTEERMTWFNFHLPIMQTKDDMRYRRAAVDTTLVRRTFRLQPDFTLILYRNHYNRYFRLNADMALTAPDLANRVDVRDDYNPLVVLLANPALKNSWRYNIRSEFYERNPETRSEWYLSGHAWFGRNDVAMSYSYNPQTGVYTYQQQNVNGNRGVNFRTVYNSSEFARFWHWGAEVNYDFQRSVDLSSVEGLTESVLSTVHNHNLSAVAAVGFQREKLSFSLGGEMKYRHATCNRVGFNTVDAFEFRYGGRLNYTLPWDIGFFTQLNMYSRRGYDEAAMNTDYLIWNASLSRSFLKGRLSVKLEGVDLLRQMRSVFMDVNVQGKTETYYNTVKGYYMLTLGWKLRTRSSEEK